MLTEEMAPEEVRGTALTTLREVGGDSDAPSADRLDAIDALLYVEGLTLPAVLLAQEVATSIARDDNALPRDRVRAARVLASYYSPLRESEEIGRGFTDVVEALKAIADTVRDVKQCMQQEQYRREARPSWFERFKRRLLRKGAYGPR